MTDIEIEQATLSRSGGVCRVLARSAGFLEEWLSEVERLAAGFGDRPDGMRCPEAVFARPLGKERVAIVRVADLEGETPLLAFHFLVMPRAAYRGFGGDPFLLAERAAPAWRQRGGISTLRWPAEPLPPRTVAEVRAVLQQTKTAALAKDEEAVAADTKENKASEAALSPALLGGAQALVDGGRLVFERPAPDPALMHALWTLLPTSTRSGLWPATFTFGNALGFDALVAPPETVSQAQRDGYITEDQACDYPQGHYELGVQIAAEAGDQAALDALFSRRSSSETLRLAFILLVAVGAVALALSWFQPPPPPPPKKLPRAQGQAIHFTRMVGTGNAWQAVSLYLARPDLFKEAPPKEAP